MLTLRTLVLGLLFFAQAQTYPPPYPRPGTTKVMENDLVIVWDVSWRGSSGGGGYAGQLRTSSSSAITVREIEALVAGR